MEGVADHFPLYVRLKQRGPAKTPVQIEEPKVEIKETPAPPIKTKAKSKKK